MQSDLHRALEHAREHTDALFRLIRPDSLYERPIPERHRMVFYIGHLEAFDWNLIGRYALGRSPFHAAFDQLFAFGIDPPPGQLPGDQPSDWPELSEIETYCRRVRERVDGALEAVPEHLVHVAIEHRLMHAETFAYILHALAYDRKCGPAPQVTAAVTARRGEMIEIPAGAAQLGLARNGAFGWDNEFEAHEADVPAFAIAKHKVTNGEYLEFVRAGGAPTPHFWSERGGRYFYRGMFAEIPLPLDWPVYVTLREAGVYAKTKGRSLPTEAQFHRAASLAPLEREGNYNFRRWDPEPVTANDSGKNAPRQLTGNGWEWTSTAFAPFPGFEPFPFYRNYSEPFFDGAHYVLKGASPRTAACFTRPSFRNWFRPSYPYIYATFRLVDA
jgi:formylglycine-generating enzyme required for sulfatase activity